MLSVGRGGRTLGQPTKHVRTHTHKLKPLNHFTVVPQLLSFLCYQHPPVQPTSRDLERPQKRQQRRRTHNRSRPLTAAAPAKETGRTGRRDGRRRRRRCRNRAPTNDDGEIDAPLVAGAPRRSVPPRPPPNRMRNWQVLGGRVTNTVGCAALPENPHARPIPARAAARGQSHAGHTMLCCAEPPPDWPSAQVGGTSSASTGGATLRKNTAARLQWNRAPSNATVPLGGPSPLFNPFSRGGADPESRVAAAVHEP